MNVGASCERRAGDEHLRDYCLKWSASWHAIGRAAFVAISLCATALAQHTDEPQRSDDSDWYREIPSSEPYLALRPMRRENISDEEVREVQDAALQVYPDFIVVISGVTDGCACEEGGQCSAQVGLALNRNNLTRSLVLSKIDGHWKVGAVQSWWLKFREFETAHPRPTKWDALQDWERARQVLLKSYPACPAPAGNWTLLRQAGAFSTFIDMSNMTVSGFVRRVHVKHVYPETPRKSSYAVRFTISLEAFDCKDRRERIDKAMDYYADGTVRQSAVEDPVLWRPIRADTVSAKDLDMVCGASVN
jgi:hypothetical protein